MGVVGEHLPLLGWAGIVLVTGCLTVLTVPPRRKATYDLTTAVSAADPDRLERFQGITVPTAVLLGLERRGGVRDEPVFAGIQLCLSERVATDRWAVIGPSEGFVIGAVDISSEQTLERIELCGHPRASDPAQEPSGPAFAELDPVTVSEVLADLTELVTR